MPVSAIDIHFESLTDVLSQWRDQTVEVASLGVPPHITLLYPWRTAPLKEADLFDLEEVLNPFQPFTLCFDRIGTFESGVVFLSISDEIVLRQMMQAIFLAFPDTPPYGGAFPDPSPHLTIAKCKPEKLSQLQSEIAQSLVLPLEFEISKVSVMEEKEDGYWYKRRAISL